MRKQFLNLIAIIIVTCLFQINCVKNEPPVYKKNIEEKEAHKTTMKENQEMEFEDKENEEKKTIKLQENLDKEIQEIEKLEEIENNAVIKEEAAPDEELSRLEQNFLDEKELENLENQ